EVAVTALLPELLMNAPAAASTGLAPFTVAPEAMVRSPDVKRERPPLVVAPVVPWTVPTPSAELSVTARLAALAAMMPIWLPAALSMKLPLPPESNRLLAAMVPPD